MAPTDDERREVAARLRAYPGDGMALSHVRRALKIPSKSRSSQDWLIVFEMLADLIEPEPERTCSDVGDGGEFECSECGCKVARHASFPDAFENPNWGAAVTLGGREAEIRHCPNCGARVVSD
jgi:hypothetical protein